MSKSKAKGVPRTVDDDNPPLDNKTLARMRPAREVVPEIVKAAAKIGRPKPEPSSKRRRK